MAGKPVLIAFGSNIDPLENLYRGLVLLHQAIGIQRVSTVWKTRALTDPNQPEKREQEPDYYNGVVLVNDGVGDWPPLELRHRLRSIEHQCGRLRSQERYAPRTLDLDVVLMGPRIFAGDGMILPDPDLLHRPFIAIPCAELVPDLVHPRHAMTMETLAKKMAKIPETMVPNHTASLRLATIPQQMAGVP
ncbi:MAG: 2-amino-4-hydroxy-6-hydroxymethyldihydropteridine pyrophosphokinase [Magnetococcales bacterium]|nr:2-amino-4-hydroxy-6-hydroxymethyldihydropteridine pyrophosphokinase [Magnetococcales bacterium]HIJ85586.1 2-amino-4-hydroxy-6-hydroxymethyldihydropteridine diphosphokinase [Magnetococcales bacterium]